MYRSLEYLRLHELGLVLLQFLPLMKRSSGSFEIALSALSCAGAAVALIVGGYVDFLYGMGIILAVFAVMIPLTKDLVRGAFLCYAAAGLIALPFATWFTVPFFVFFGLHPIVNYLQKKYVKRTPLRILCFAAKAAWFDLSLWLSFFVLSSFVHFEFAAWIGEYLYYVLFLGGTLLFFAYDIAIFYCQRALNYAVRRIGR